jgi:hypothetical protein
MKGIRQLSIPPMRMVLPFFPRQQKARYFGNGLFCDLLSPLFQAAERKRLMNKEKESTRCEKAVPSTESTASKKSTSPSATLIFNDQAVIPEPSSALLGSLALLNLLRRRRKSTPLPKPPCRSSWKFFCLKIPIVFRIGERLEEGDKRCLILLTQIEPTLGMLRQVGRK